jgi:D-amino-acid dehydrogenase
MPNATPLADAPIVYGNEHIVVTPMAGRVRATSFMEFAAHRCAIGSAQAGLAARPGDQARLRLRRVAAVLGRPRPVLPDYLPARAAPRTCRTCSTRSPISTSASR